MLLLFSRMTIFTIGYSLPLFYVQLDSTTRGLNTTFSFYTVSSFNTGFLHFLTGLHHTSQLAILNAASFCGRILPGFFARQLGVGNIIAAATGGCAVMIFGMIGIKTLPEFIVFDLLYGFFAGTCKTLFNRVQYHFTDNILLKDISMNGPLMATLTDDISELG